MLLYLLVVRPVVRLQQLVNTAFKLVPKLLNDLTLHRLTFVTLFLLLNALKMLRLEELVTLVERPGGHKVVTGSADELLHAGVVAVERSLVLHDHLWLEHVLEKRLRFGQIAAVEQLNVSAPVQQPVARLDGVAVDLFYAQVIAFESHLDELTQLVAKFRLQIGHTTAELLAAGHLAARIGHQETFESLETRADVLTDHAQVLRLAVLNLQDFRQVLVTADAAQRVAARPAPVAHQEAPRLVGLRGAGGLEQIT